MIRSPNGSTSSATPRPTGSTTLELNIAITAMPIDESGMPDLKIPRQFLPHLTDEELLRHPGVLSGSTRDMADRIRGYRDTYGVSYIIVQAPHAEVVREGDRRAALSRVVSPGSTVAVG